MTYLLFLLIYKVILDLKFRVRRASSIFISCLSSGWIAKFSRQFKWNFLYKINTNIYETSYFYIAKLDIEMFPFSCKFHVNLA